MTKKMKKRRKRIVCGALLFILAILVRELQLIHDSNVQLILFLVAYLTTGGDVIKKAARNIRNGQVLDENFLMVIASLGAFLISEMSEAVGVMLFYQLSDRSSRSVYRIILEKLPDLIKKHNSYRFTHFADQKSPERGDDH